LASGTGGGGGGGTEEGPEIEALYCAIVIPCKQKSYKEGKKMMFR
jgi:hypothetical protein